MGSCACIIGRNGIRLSAVKISSAPFGLGIPSQGDIAFALVFQTEQQLVNEFGTLRHRQMQSSFF